MSFSNYRGFLKLLEKWPIDATKKGGRDLGEHLRICVTNAFKQGDATPVDEVNCQRILSSLDRIASNTYAKRYQRVLGSSSTGLTYEQCCEFNSSEFFESIKE